MRHGSLPHIEQLIEAGGVITVGALPPLPCVAAADLKEEAPAQIRRRRGETLPQLLERLDGAIGTWFESGDPVDEVSSPPRTFR